MWKISFAGHGWSFLRPCIGIANRSRCSLFTRFTLSTTSHQHVRIKNTELRSTNPDDDSLEITKSMLQQSRIVVCIVCMKIDLHLLKVQQTVTPEQPGRFLFQLDSKKDKARDPLHLHITYRILREGELSRRWWLCALKIVHQRWSL
jgi:hypothetical protein